MKTPKTHGFFYVLFFIVISTGLMYTACKKKKEPFEIPRAENVLVTTELSYNYDDNDDYIYRLERTPVKDKINPIDENPIKLPFSTNAHKKYLDDPLVFENLPDGGIPEGPTAVVGSDVCFFYPIETVSVMEDLKKLPAGEKIPFASIISLGNKLICKNSKLYGNPFEFQGNINYFYQTTWNGKQGIVFGADLYHEWEKVISSNEENRVNSLLYKTNGFFKSFFPVTGYDAIREDIQNDLKTNGLSFQEVKKSEYRLSFDHPDDMITLYINIDKGSANFFNFKVTPVFITTDLAAHSNHLVFDRLLQYCEEEYFFPQLYTLVNEYIKTIEQKKGEIPDAVYNTSMLYFLTAKALLALAPKKVENEDGYRKTISYNDVNAEQVLSKYPQQVAKEIEQMNNAEGFGSSAVFPGMKEDYSQYKVRGHYTKNGVLGAYFRALMWFGRINFNLGGETDIAKNAAEKLAPTALFITDLTENSPQIKKLWQSLFDPITELIGVSDDISFYELAPLWNKVKGADFLQWYNNPAKLKDFISKEYKELRPPSISGFSLGDLVGGVYDGGKEMKDRLPPVGWRLFGQRYTLDSEIHHYASPPRFLIPRIPPENQRHMVKGLDIMKVFGSKTADRLLRESDYPKYSGLEKVMNSLQQSMTSIKDDYWFSTYYTNILYQIRTQALFENGTGFYFTEKPAWNLKAMNSAHGTWAELRHDTLLYVKQNYGEATGGSTLTFRTKPLPKPIHYIEPNIPFWNTSAVGIQKLYRILEKYDFLDGRSAKTLAGLHGIFVKAAEISKLEADDKEVSAKDLEWIATIPNQLAKLVVALLSGDYVDNEDSLRMALVADVFTAVETLPSQVLEAAVGIPYRLYIPLNDKQGGKRIAVGYGFSYYEFTQPMSNRLNNDEWKAIVYTDNFDMKKYLPFWMQGKISRAK